MAFPQQHEIHRRRFGRNLGLGIALALFVALVFGLTVVKVEQEGPVQGLDRPSDPRAVQAPGAGG